MIELISKAKIKPNGETVIEKHITLNCSDGGVGSTFSMEIDEMKQLVIEMERAWQSLGNVNHGPIEAEKPSLVYRRFLYNFKNIKKGEKFVKKNLCIIQPGKDLQLKYCDITLGREVNLDVKKRVRRRVGI